MNKNTKDQIIEDYTHGKSTKTALQAVTDRMNEQRNQHLADDKEIVKAWAVVAITILFVLLAAAILIIGKV